MRILRILLTAFILFSATTISFAQSIQVKKVTYDERLNPQIELIIENYRDVSITNVYIDVVFCYDGVSSSSIFNHFKTVKRNLAINIPSRQSREITIRVQLPEPENGMNFRFYNVYLKNARFADGTILN